MDLQNVIEYEEIREQLSIIQKACEDTKISLDFIDREIKDSVGADGAAWSGKSATEFRTSWDGLAEELPTFISYVNTQVRNIESMLSKTEAADESGTVE